MSATATSLDTGPNPPKPTLTLRVGIVGHRPKPEKFPSALFPHVKQTIGDVFAAIDASFPAIVRANADWYSDAPPKVRLISGLAEGADQMAVEVKPEGWKLDAVLPFPRESYLADFKVSATGKKKHVTAEFETALAKAANVVAAPDHPRIEAEGLSPENNAPEYERLRKEGYQRFGAFLLRQIDLLVVVWDGQREAGIGGTGQVVRGAVEAGIPVVWISSTDFTFARMIEGIEDDGRPVAPPADCCRGALAEKVSTILSIPPDVASPDQIYGTVHPKVVDRLKSFFAENWPRPCRWITYDLFKRWIEGKKPRLLIHPETLDDYRKRWQPLLDEAPEAGTLNARISRMLLLRYAWADALAVDFANRQRTAYVNCYLMAALAVFIALFGLFAPFQSQAQQLTFKIFLVVTEIGLILSIYHIVRTVRKSRWHEKWIEYRTLAEMLWGVRFLAYLGEHGQVQRANEFEPARSAWLIWYLRATIREVGIPHAVLDASYQRKHLTAVENHVIDDQIDYHRRNAMTLARMHQFLRHSAAFCFHVTIAILAIFFLAWAVFAAGMWWEGKSIGTILGIAEGSTSELSRATFFEKLGVTLYSMKNWVTFAAAFAPALGAAVAGIRESGDFERFAERSAKTFEALKDLKHDIAQAKRKLTLESTSDTMFSTAQILTEDLAAWNSVYGRKQLELPS